MTCPSQCPHSVKHKYVFARSNAGIVVSNPTQGMDVCARFILCCAILYVEVQPCDGLIHRPRSLLIVETEKAAKVQQRAVEPYTNNCHKYYDVLCSIYWLYRQAELQSIITVAFSL
jgi:hypothetical protein